MRSWRRSILIWLPVISRTVIGSVLLRLPIRYAFRCSIFIDAHSFLQALAKNPKNSKALFRKAKALGEQGYFEKAEAILTELLKEDSTGSLFAHSS